MVKSKKKSIQKCYWGNNFYSLRVLNLRNRKVDTLTKRGYKTIKGNYPHSDNGLERALLRTDK